MRFVTVTAVGEFDNLIDLHAISRANVPTLQVAQIFGGPGNDTIFGPEVNSTLDGQHGNDHIESNDADDNVFGGPGDDTLVIRDGEDNYDGGDGNDHYWFARATDAGINIVADSSGVDTINFSAFNGVTFDAGNFSPQQVATNSLLTLSTGTTLERLIGSPGDDVLYVADGVQSTLTGFDGNDSLIGSSNNDHLEGGEGTNVLAGGDGNDTYLIEKGHSKILDTNGDDTVDFSGVMAPATFNF
ncbi:MAG: hypothetical protein R3C28_28775 [Pirellulaceae bacterium]